MNEKSFWYTKIYCIIKVVLGMYEVEVKRLDHQGRGIGYIDNKITFIKNALPNEVVVCKLIHETKKYNVAEVVEYKKQSSKRIEPFCPYFEFCGGCDLQHLSYEDTLQFKKEKVKNILAKEKIDFPEIVVIENPSPKNYRNKLSLKIENGKLGFYEEKSHHLIEIESCPIAKESINFCLQKLKILNIKNGNVIIRSNYNNEILLIIETAEKIDINIENRKDLKIVGIVFNGKTIYGQNFFYERINHMLFKVSFDAFFQVNSFVTEKMFELVEENITKINVVLDLYSGVGTLGLIASKNASKVYSIEIIKNAVLDNLENIKLNQRENIFPMLGDVFKVLPKIKDTFDTILIDPPRKGLDKKSLNLILDSNASKIIYISCNPMTLSRDLKELTNRYKIKKFYILDMFSYTHHIESMVILEKII